MRRLVPAALGAALSGIPAAHASTCSLMVLDTSYLTQVDKVLRFTNPTAVANFFGTNRQTKVANDFFANSVDCSHPIIQYTRFPIVPARAHLYGGNLYGTTPTGNGSVRISSQGHTWISAPDILTGALKKDATNLKTAINATLPEVASFSGSLIPASCKFMGYISYITLNVTDTGSCAEGVPLGAQFCDGQFTGSDTGSSCSGGQIASGQ